MKVAKQYKDFKFKPITLSVVIENKKELDALIEFCGNNYTNTEVAREYGELSIDNRPAVLEFLDGIYQGLRDEIT